MIRARQWVSGIGATVCALLLGGMAVSVAQTAPPPPTDQTYYACAHKATGVIRAVGESDACKDGESRLIWNSRGPIGPQGPAGAAGADGADGQDGAMGPAGPAGVNSIDALDGTPCRTGTAEASTLELEWANGTPVLTCGPASPPPPPPPPATTTMQHFYAPLSGTAVVPSVNTAGAGDAIVTLDEASDSVCANVEWTSVSGVTGVFLRRGTTGVNGPIVMVVSSAVNGTSAQRCEALPDDVQTELRNNGLHISVHSQAYPAGELRGDLRPMPRDAIGGMDRSQIVADPPSISSGTGVAKATVNDTQLCFSAEWRDVSNPTAVHVHQAPAGANGPLLTSLSMATDRQSGAACLDLSPRLYGSLYRDLLYVSVKSAAYPAGEIRGQLAV